MWDPLLEPGLALLHGSRGANRHFLQELAHHTLHTRSGTVLWCDGDHGFDPYDFAELNLTRGHSADTHADRLLVKRCMTPFQWDSVLTNHLREKLAATPSPLVIAAPFNHQFSTDELSDWEAEDYVRYATRHLRNLARRHRIPIVIGIDMARWWKSHPALAEITYTAADHKWSVAKVANRWRITRADGRELDPMLRTRVTLLDFEPMQVAA